MNQQQKLQKYIIYNLFDSESRFADDHTEPGIMYPMIEWETLISSFSSVVSPFTDIIV